MWQTEKDILIVATKTEETKDMWTAKIWHLGFGVGYTNETQISSKHQEGLVADHDQAPI